MYKLLWRNKFLTLSASSIEDFIDTFETSLANLKSMKKAGVTLDPDSGVEDDYAEFVTEDGCVAQEFDFDDEEYLEGDDEND